MIDERIYKTGVYKIINLVNGKYYIGSAARFDDKGNNRGFYFRFRGHKYALSIGKHKNKHLQASYNKYGKDNFKFEIIAICPPEYCLKLEQWFIDNMKPHYNKTTIAGSVLGIRWSEETKKKHSIRKLGTKLSEEGRIANRDKRRLAKSITKLSIDNVKEIRLQLLKGIDYKILAKKYEVSANCIQDVKHYRTFKDIKI